jgi:hypothetical protein
MPELQPASCQTIDLTPQQISEIHIPIEHHIFIIIRTKYKYQPTPFKNKLHYSHILCIQRQMFKEATKIKLAVFGILQTALYRKFTRMYSMSRNQKVPSRNESTIKMLTGNLIIVQER